jgi:hypothetical protein
MKCPMCNTNDLTFVYLDPNLPSHTCMECTGSWVSFIEYYAWLTQSRIYLGGNNFAEEVVKSLCEMA